MSQTSAMNGVKNVRSGTRWFCRRLRMAGSLSALTKDGYTVSVVQNPTMTLADDVAFTKPRSAAQRPDRHSRWSPVRRRRDHGSRRTIPKVDGTRLCGGVCADAGGVCVDVDRESATWRARCRRSCHLRTGISSSIGRSSASFAADVAADEADVMFMADSQATMGPRALNGTISKPAWKAKAELVPAHHRG